MEVEKWKDINGFEGIYKISSFGRLKSFKVKKEGRIMSTINKKGWYLSVVLVSKNKINESHKIHSLVGKYFIDNTFNKKYINHKDSNKQNNHYLNLEWCTCSENALHAISFNPNIIKGINEYNKKRSKKIQQFDLKNTFLAEYFNGTEASKITGVCERNIYQVASKDEYKKGFTRKQAGGFIWKYKE